MIKITQPFDNSLNIYFDNTETFYDNLMSLGFSGEQSEYILENCNVSAITRVIFIRDVDIIELCKEILPEYFI